LNQNQYSFITFIHEEQLYDKHGLKTKKEIQSTYDHAKDEVL